MPLSTLPCGDIDPLRTTGTPEYESVTGSIFAVAEVTRPHNVLFALGPFGSHVARTFGVTGVVVPANATAVTGNLTVTQQTSLG